MIETNNNFIVLQTKSTSLVFEIKDYNDEATPFNKGKKYVKQFFYGYKKECPDIIASKNVLPGPGSNNDYNIDQLISSTYGNGNQKEPLLLIENCDNTFVNRFFYKEHKIIKGNKEVKGPHTRNVSETLEIIEVDDTLQIELHHYYSIMEDSDIIVSKKEIINHGSLCEIRRAFSLELPINGNDLTVESFDGAWLFERSRHSNRILSGCFSVDSKSGGSSNRHNPYIQVIDNSRNDLIYGVNLIYSGNHKELVEINPLSYSTIMTGINDFAFSYKLDKGESFITPEAIFVVKENKDDLTSEMHNFVKHHIIDPKYLNKTRPILFNNWEGTGMKIDEKTLLDMAVIAKKTGVEQFVVDDGWFKNRITDNGGLGDWSVDTNKFPDGLKSFVDKIKGLGLKFGIWIEPEMICINTDLYKKHPEFACIIPNRDPIERRHQLMIDLSNKEVIDYLFVSLTKVFDQIKPDYIKWDYNRFHADMYSPKGVKAGEFLYRTIYGSYELFDKLTSRYPDTLFEGCASGGARFDLGMLYYTPQIWGSDDTNTYLRTFITCGTLTAYPHTSIGAHVSRDGCPIENRKAISSLEDRFNLNCVGAFGYEFDFRTFSQEELSILSNQIEYYKKHRELLQNGDFHICADVFDDHRYFSYCVVSNDKKEAILFIEETEANLKGRKWVVKGLDINKKYMVEMRKQYNLNKQFRKQYFGKQLVENGISLGSLCKTNDCSKYPHGVFTRLFYIKEV